MGKGNRKRTMTDEEIALAKGMLAKGMKNDAVHFYFNRADRLISSGRIAQIKKGKYGASVTAASPEELEVFLADWQARQLPGTARGPTSPTDQETILALFVEDGGVWTVRSGETDQAECKKSFRLAPEERFAGIIKTIAGLANNKGGYILFGVRDDTMAVEGLSVDTFATTDPAEINRCLAGALDPVPHVTKILADIGGKAVGVLYVEKHAHPPIIALKNIAGDVREGSIYYRYVGETRPIKPGELRQIIANREQRAVAEFTHRMTRVASGVEATIDLDTGEVKGRTGAFVIDKDLLPSIQFIREGDFTEVKGAPALRLIGDVQPVSASERERVRIIRDNVTPDAVIRNFLRGETVADPMQYIHLQAHAQRRWLPVWYYVKQAGVPVEVIVEDLRGQVATHPASRDAVVRRLLRTTSAYKKQSGKEAQLLALFARGETVGPTNAVEDMAFAYAVQGLPDNYADAEQFKPVLLASLDRAQGSDTRSSSRRSAIYRASCRLDELLSASPGPSARMGSP